MARMYEDLPRQLDRSCQSGGGERRCGGRVEEVLSLLFAEKEEEFVPSPASVETFPIGVVVVLVEIESAGLKVLPCCESSRERAT